MAFTRHLPDRVRIREVGPRDGLQPEPRVSVAGRVRLIESLLDAGVTHLEVAAFVSPKAVPAMAGAAEVLAALTRRPGCTYAALVPNLKGAELALGAGVDELTVTISASETYNQRNVNRSTSESLAAIGAIVSLARGSSSRDGAEPDSRHDGGAVPVDAVISCAFGSPYEGEIAPVTVAALARRLADAGARVSYADTTGMATPRRIDDLLDVLEDDLAADVGLHLHDTRGVALANAYAALERGVVRFDTSVGGLGGSPFAHGAGGNLATEGLVALLDDLGVDSGIDLEGLLRSAEVVAGLVDRPLPSPIAHHGPRTRLATPG